MRDAEEMRDDIEMYKEIRSIAEETISRVRSKVAVMEGVREDAILNIIRLETELKEEL